MTFFLLVAFCLFWGCERKPVEPEPRVHEGYYVYGVNWNHAGNDEYLFRYDTHKKQFDSLSLPGLVFGRYSLAAAETTDQIFANTAMNSGLVTVCVQELVDCGKRPFPSGSISMSANGSILARSGVGIQFIDARTFQILFSLPYTGTPGHFCSGGEWFVTGYITDTSTTGYQALRVNTQNWQTSTHLTGLNPIQVAFLPEDDLWVSYSRLSSLDFAIVVANDDDSILYSHFFSPGAGNFVVDQPRRIIYFTNPGNGLLGSPFQPSPFLYTVSLDGFSLDSISLERIITSGFPEQFIPDFLTISSDDSVLAITEYGRSRYLIMRLKDRVVTDTTDGANEFVGFGKPVITRRYIP